MKTFKDLVFKKKDEYHMHASIKFENGEAVSVLYGKGAWSDENTYECWYSNESDPSGFQTPEEITQGMIYLQKYYKNAKHEILGLAKQKEIRCISIKMLDINKKFTLPENKNGFGYNADNTCLNEFLKDLDYCYEDDCCTGIIWFTDGSWAERFEHHDIYDYQDWLIHSCPAIPEKLLTNKF